MLKLSILALNKEIFSGTVKSVSVPSVTGRLQILPEHIPLVTKLVEGDVVFETESGSQTVPISGGVLEVRKGEVVILASF